MNGKDKKYMPPCPPKEGSAKINVFKACFSLIGVIL
jgi:hypothetical protein